MFRELPYLPAPPGLAVLRSARRAIAIALRRLSDALDKFAVLVAASPVPAHAPEPVLEFYAEAGAPEGALYLDGVRVGTLDGVSRL